MADSTWGIPKPVRTVLAARITELRVGLQEDARRQLAAWGIDAERVSPPPGGRVLSADDTHAREVVLAVLETRRQAGVPREEALQAYLEEVAFTLLNRLVTFRCLEERGLVLVAGQAETLVRRDPVRGTSALVWRTRDANRDLDERAIARTAYRTACAAMTERVKVLFDADDEPSAIFPTLPLWQRAMDALNDPAIPPATFAQDEIMGWVYQYWSTELKQVVYDKLARGGKIEDPSELAAATCLYTERYIVDYLVQNTLGATWVEMHPETRLPERWPYYVRPPEGNPPVERERKRVRDLTLIDPCVGSGHFLVRAFDLFAQLYAEEAIEQPEDIADLILERNLYGADIDRRAVQIAALALYVKGCALAGADFRPRMLNLVACDIAIPPAPPAEFLESLEEPELKDLARSLWSGLAGIRTFGSLLHPERSVNEAFAKLKGKGTLWADDTDWVKRRAHFMTGLRKAFTAAAGDTDLGTRLFGEEASRGLDALQILGRRYDVVVTNPPYQGATGLPADVRALLDTSYPEGKRDLYAAFIQRCWQLASSLGTVGMLTQQSWLYQTSFEPLRRWVLGESHLRSLIHLGPGAFEEISGVVVNTVAFTFSRRQPAVSSLVRAVRLVSYATPGDKQQGLLDDALGSTRSTFVARLDRFQNTPGASITYWLSDSWMNLINEASKQVPLKVSGGFGTRDEERFVRCHWETGSGSSGSTAWRRYSKGGGYRRWAGLETFVVDYTDDGERVAESLRRKYPYLKGNVGILVRDRALYGSPGLTYSDIANAALGVRVLDDSLFSDTSPGIFSERRFETVALLNARPATYVLRAVAPGSLHYSAAYLSAIPRMGRPFHQLESTGLAASLLGRSRVADDPSEHSFSRVQVEGGIDPEVLPLLHALEGWNERLVLDALGLGPEDVEAVIDETGVPAGWNPLIAGYDRLPEAPDGIEVPDGLADFLATLEHRQLGAPELAKVKARLRAMYEAGPGTREEVEAPAAKGDDGEEGAAVVARIPIPTETFLEELAVKTELHPITVHWLLEELKADGVVSPPLRKTEIEEYIDITLVRMLAYRWPEQDAYEANHGPILDADLVDADGIIPLVPCGDEPVAEERVRTRLVRQLGDDGADAFLADLKRYTKRDLADWIRRDFFKAHTKRFKNRPIAWHLRSPEGAFEALVLYHRLSRETLAKLRVTYAGDRLARLRADQQRAKEADDTRTVTDLQVQIEDVEAFRATLAAIQQGSELKHRIRCRWKGETDTGRPGPYNPDIDDGVKVNIRPFQETGLLPAKVISKW